MTAPISPHHDARIEATALDRRYVIVDTDFARKLETEHERAFDLLAEETPAGPQTFTRDVPNVGDEALENLDDRGVARVGTEVVPGTLLVGRVEERGAGSASPEEKLLRAIFGDKAGNLRDVSLRAPPGCFGTVREVEVAADRVQVIVAWTRPLDVGDVLEIAGEEVVVAAIRPLGADLAWSGGRTAAAVAKLATARDTLHARSIGPYDQVTQQPTEGRDAIGGQPLDRRQVEILASHAPWTLWELFTIKSDSVTGRTRAYEGMVKGDNPYVPPEPVSDPPASEGGDIFAFFERPQPKEGEVECLLPGAVSALSAHLRALGLEVSFAAIQIDAKLLDTARIRAMSHGEVIRGATKDSEMKPEAGGIFCQKIFGPVEDYRCACGKYARMKHRGIVCEECGVEVISSRVRRERFGHVRLAVPCVHPLFREEVQTLLGKPPSPGASTLNALAALDLEAIDATEVGPRADLALALLEAEIIPSMLMLSDLLVLPPDLRPEDSSLNDVYRLVVEQNERLRGSGNAGAPKKESDALQAAVDRLFAELRATVDALWAQNVFTKRVDYSGVAHLVADQSLETDRCRVPRSMLVELFKPFAYGALEARGYVTTIKSAKRMIERATPEAMAAVDEVSEGYPLLLASGENLVVRRAEAWDAPAIAVDTSTASRLASRTVAIHVPLTHQAALECSTLSDGLWAQLRSSKGWLARADASTSFVAEVRRAALDGLEDTVDDPLLACALGRPPAMPEPEALEAWRLDDERRRAAVQERTAPAADDPAEPSPWADRRIDELELSVMSANALAEAGIQTIAELCRRTEAELLKTRGLERQGLMEIKMILADLGLSLGMRDI